MNAAGKGGDHALSGHPWDEVACKLPRPRKSLLGLKVRLLAGLDRGQGEAPAGGDAHVRLRYSRRELAEMIGVCPETAIRLLGKLKRRGVIAPEGRQIVVTDLDKLLRVAQQGEIAG